MDIKQYGVSPNMEKELSYRFIAYLIGLLLAFESILLLACCCVSLMYGGKHHAVSLWSEKEVCSLTL